MIKFTIDLPPISKKNHQQIIINRKTGVRKVIPSKQYKQYEKDACYFIPINRKPINETVNVKCMFYMPTRRKCDLTNMLESIDDVMVKAGLLEDDNFKIIAAHDGSRIRYDKEHPRTEVTITEMPDEHFEDVKDKKKKVA